MSFDPDRLRRFVYPAVDQDLAVRDTMLYALSVGYGSDPTDPRQLRYVFENDLLAAPTLAITLCYPSVLSEMASACGFRPETVLHVSQTFRLERPLPVAARLRGQTCITGVYDKGERGTLWTYRNRVVDRDTGALVCELDAASMTRAHGGWGGDRGPASQDSPVPARAADAVATWRTPPDAALLYRLSGDWNPLHADPAVARRAGFAAPILHGRCTYGIAGRAIVQAFCDHDGRRLKGMSARFTASVYPGETIRTEMWSTPDGIRFRSRVVERDLVVLDYGTAQIDRG